VAVLAVEVQVDTKKVLAVAVVEVCAVALPLLAVVVALNLNVP
jgi:hypothetical protein